MDPLARIGPAPGGALDRAVSLVEAFLEISDDPEYNAIYAQLLGARGDPGFADQASRAAAACESLLARRHPRAPRP